MQFADRLNNVETSAIRELFKLLGKPGIISFAGGFPDSAMFDVAGISAASQAALQQEPGAALQYGATEGYQPLREQIAAFMAAKGARDLAPDQLVVTTGSQQALDLLGKTLISPGDKVIVEGPTFLATIQCFRLYGAEVISAPIDAEGARVDALEKLIAEHQPKLVYLIPTFGNPSGAMLSLERRKKVLELAVKYQTLVVEDDPYGDLYFGEAPPPSLLALSSEVPGSRDWLAHCGSLSKVLSPGLRIGWLVAPAALLGRAVMCKQFSDAVEFLQPQGGLFLWVRLTGKGGALADAGELAKRAIAQGVAFVPGAPFFAQNPDATSFRLSFATADEDKIREGIARLAQALKA
jgi:DNA-binding transcriptional MocR family regulator